jgi:hypothetical protein
MDFNIKESLGLQIVNQALPSTAEYIISTNVKNPIKITGVATAQIRNSKKDEWRKGYLVFYEDCGAVKKGEINEELYRALHLVFDTLNDDGNINLID